ncbi:MAG: hypothetical protein A2189_00665 [Paenibacillus sp. RIFOXYA1_FULL_44_5]|nr:MAG: hypothetical protein A2189_00665 [Paenibacillus sp. RIFOXYA1_FULL_44_5]
MAFVSVKQTYSKDVVARLSNGEKLNIIDVREPDEWAWGHIKEAKLIPLGQIAGRLNELDKDAEIIVVCQSGGRSSMASEFLAEKGFNVVNMVGGMMGWVGDVERGM